MTIIGKPIIGGDFIGDIIGGTLIGPSGAGDISLLLEILFNSGIDLISFNTGADTITFGVA